MIGCKTQSEMQSYLQDYLYLLGCYYKINKLQLNAGKMALMQMINPYDRNHSIKLQIGTQDRDTVHDQNNVKIWGFSKQTLTACKLR